VVVEGQYSTVMFGECGDQGGFALLSGVADLLDEFAHLQVESRLLVAGLTPMGVVGQPHRDLTQPGSSRVGRLHAWSPCCESPN
jgi:hypothetical protein